MADEPRKRTIEEVEADMATAEATRAARRRLTGVDEPDDWKAPTVGREEVPNEHERRER